MIKIIIPYKSFTKAMMAYEVIRDKTGLVGWIEDEDGNNIYKGDIYQ